ncbi:M23 family metallopeptidase [Streptomyces uncialis]|uniref:M23 family metallopeptidase n=1 Tax=Streptomyces uncialis TaxID=1048205 RepID=UPI003F4D536D
MSYDQGTHSGYTGYDGYSTGSFATTSTGSFETDPLFGDMSAGGYDSGQWAAVGATGTHTTLTPDPYTQQDNGYDTGAYATTDGWDTSGYQQFGGVAERSPLAGDTGTGQWETQQFAGTTYDTRSFEAQNPDTGGFEAGAFDTGSFDTGSFDTGGFSTGTGGTDGFGTGTYETGGYETAGDTGAQRFDSGAYDATAWNTDGDESAQHAPGYPERESYAEPEQTPYAGQDPYSAEYPQHDTYAGQRSHTEYPDESPGYPDHTAYEESDTGTTGVLPEIDVTDDTGALPAQDHELPLLETDLGDGALPDDEHVVLSRRAAAPAPRSRSRRRPAKRSALLTVAVPSACVMGVAGIAAASVGMTGDSDTKDTATAAPEVTPVKPSVANSKLDTQIAGLSADAGDFADRASRTQERLDLKAQQEVDRKKAIEEAARKERLRPKFALPVHQRGLSAYYGQAGINWMSSHTGIDFPVAYGAPVMAATDGTVRTQINPAYGNMAIVTAKDGTETWYCHLSRYSILNGPVKAGDVIAYAGDSGNSTGAHLHFEVRPGGGSAIDPLAWLRSHGLEPT